MCKRRMGGSAGFRWTRCQPGAKMLGVPQRTGLAMPTQSMCNASTKVARVAWATLHRWTPVSSSLLQDSTTGSMGGCQHLDCRPAAEGMRLADKSRTSSLPRWLSGGSHLGQEVSPENSKRKKISNRTKFFSVKPRGPFGPIGIRDSHTLPATPHCLGVVIVCAHILEPTVSKESPFDHCLECAYP